MISAPSISDSFNHHQLLLSLCSDSVSHLLLQRPLKSAVFQKPEKCSDSSFHISLLKILHLSNRNLTGGSPDVGFLPLKVVRLPVGKLFSKCNDITHVLLFFIDLGSQQSRVKSLKQCPCLQKCPDWLMFMEHPSLLPSSLASSVRSLMLLIITADGLCEMTEHELPARHDTDECYISILLVYGEEGGSGWSCRIPTPYHADTHHSEESPPSQAGELDLCHEHCIEVEDGWRTIFSQDITEGLCNSLIPHICIQGKTTVVNHDCKARKRVKPWEDTVLVDSSVLRFSAITIPMWEAIKLHSWKINICSRQTKRNQWKHWVGIYTEIWSLSC